jgi:uncharacterized membrane protein
MDRSIWFALASMLFAADTTVIARTGLYDFSGDVALSLVRALLFC